RRDPAPGARLLGSPGRRDPRLRRPRSAAQAGRRVGASPAPSNAKGRRLPAAFFFYGSPDRLIFWCNAKDKLLLCKQINCIWHLVYIDWLQTTKRDRRFPEKGTPDVQDCRYFARAFRLPVRPPDGIDRPAADDQRPHCRPQRRPPVFWALSLKWGFGAPRVEARPSPP